MEMFKFYEVGGKVRDEILGLQSKDIDYVAVPSEDLRREVSSAHTMFNILEGYLKEERFETFLVTPDCFTIRAKFPEGHQHQGVADFVMARKEVGYIPGTRQPMVVPGSLYDDLERRDFTLNAIAKDAEGNLIDFFGGLKDLEDGVLRTPLPCEVTFKDDPLRIIRAIRFMITKGFSITGEMHSQIKHFDYEVFMAVVSAERIREELLKCFKHDTAQTIKILIQYPYLFEYIMMTGIWFKPTLEAR
jgi:tRNA nucleotidyltransferase/poly(A) polymerase